VPCSFVPISVISRVVLIVYVYLKYSWTRNKSPQFFFRLITCINKKLGVIALCLFPRHKLIQERVKQRKVSWKFKKNASLILTQLSHSHPYCPSLSLRQVAITWHTTKCKWEGREKGGGVERTRQDKAINENCNKFARLKTIAFPFNFKTKITMLQHQQQQQLQLNSIKNLRQPAKKMNWIVQTQGQQKQQT